MADILDLIGYKKKVGNNKVPPPPGITNYHGVVLCVSGWKGSGKDTVANYLVRNHGYTKLSFAKPLKDMVSETYKIPRSYFDDQVMKESPIVSLPAIPSDAFTQQIHNLLRAELTKGYWTPRALCILEGSMKRAVNTNFWVKKVVEEVQKNPSKNYVISDMRYKSEADTLTLLLGKSVRTMRIERYKFIDTDDPSERDLDDYRFQIHVDNTRSVQELHNSIDQILLNWTRGYL